MIKFYSMIIACLMLTDQVHAQVNLVPNGGFDTITSCPSGNGQIYLAGPWSKIGNGALLNVCGVDDFSVPANRNGIQNALSENGYARLTMRAPTIPSYSGGGLSVPLITPLVELNTYQISFYLSMEDSAWYATKIFNAYLTSEAPTAELLSVTEPKFRYQGNFISDKTNWVHIEGTFIASGGEQYLTIGNFDGPDLTDTLYVGGGVAPPGLPNWWRFSGYYFDDISLIQVDTNVGITEKDQVVFEIFPNPVPENFNVKWSGQGPANLQLTDATGRVVLSVPLHGNKQRIDASGLPQGVYVAQVVQNGITLGRQKLFKQ